MSLRSNISWSLVGNVSFSASQWLVVSLIAKSMGVESLGLYALGLAIISPVFMFTNLNIRSVQSTDVMNRYSFHEYLWFRVITSAAALLICCSIIVALQYDFHLVEIILLLVGLKMVESVADVYFGFFQKQERLDLVGKSLMTRSFIAVLFVVAILYTTEALVALIFSLIAAYVAVFLFYDMTRKIKSSPIIYGPLSADYGKKFFDLFITALPLGVTVSVNVLYQSIPRFMVDHYHGAAALGVFAGVSYFLVVGGTVANAMAQSATPRLAKYFFSNAHAFNVLVIKLIFLASLLGFFSIAFAAIFADQFLSLVYTPEFVGHRSLFVWVMILATLTYISGVVGSALTAMQCFKIQACISCFCLLVLFSFSYILIEPYGALGGAYAMVVAYAIKILCELISLFVFFKRQHGALKVCIL